MAVAHGDISDNFDWWICSKKKLSEVNPNCPFCNIFNRQHFSGY